MPCNSDYLQANNYELQLSRVACLLAELKGKKFTLGEWDGYHPKVYMKGLSKAQGDKMVAELCGKLKEMSPKKIKSLSLEMQTWWRDHQAADAARIKQEKQEAREKKEREAAVAKLTPRERKLLGV